MWTIVKGGAVLAEAWEREVGWVPFADVVREAGTPRSFARLPSEEEAKRVAASLGGQPAEVLVRRGSDVRQDRGGFEIVLQRPPKGIAAKSPR